jgi:hypothetical protein
VRGDEVAISAFLTRLPDPRHAVRLQGCNSRYVIGNTTTGSSLVHCKLYWVARSRRSAVPYTPPGPSAGSVAGSYKALVAVC